MTYQIFAHISPGDAKAPNRTPEEAMDHVFELLADEGYDVALFLKDQGPFSGDGWKKMRPLKAK